MKTTILYLFLIFFVTQNCSKQQTIKQDSVFDRFAQEHKEHYTKTQLRGKVKSIKEIGYNLVEDKGKYKKEPRERFLEDMSYLRQRLSSSMTLFDKSGNLLETNNFDKEGNLKKLKEYKWNSLGNPSKIIFHSPSETFDSINYRYNFKDQELYTTSFYKTRPRFYNSDSVLTLFQLELDQTELELGKNPKARHQMDSIYRASVLEYASFYNNNPQPVSSEYISKYDHNGQLIERYYYDTSNVKIIVMKFSVKYEDGNIIELMNESYPDRSFGKAYKYDKRGNQIEDTFIGYDGSKSRVVVKEYDENNNVVKEQLFSLNPKILQAETIKDYDSSNNVIKSTINTSKGETSTQIFKYDSNNNIIEEQAPNRHLKYEYKYDEENNWVTKKRLKFNSKDGRFIPVSIIEREISYH